MDHTLSTNRELHQRFGRKSYQDDLEKQRQQFEQMRPIYSEEELAEIEEYEYEEDERHKYNNPL